jgi:hypothetical protein
MAGAYCQYCDRRCFVLRVMPSDATWNPGQSVHLATCTAGMEHDREQSGYDCTTTTNPSAGAASTLPLPPSVVDVSTETVGGEMPLRLSFQVRVF